MNNEFEQNNTTPEDTAADPWSVFRENDCGESTNPFDTAKVASDGANTAASAPEAQTPPQTPPQGYAPPYGYVPPQGYTPPYGYAPPQGYTPPYGYAPPKGYAPAQQEPAKKGKVGQVLMWIAAILIETVIVCFAIYGVYAWVTRNDSGNRYFGYNQGSDFSSVPNNGNGNGNSIQDGFGNDGNTSSEIGENPTDVQMGIVCGQMNEDYAAYYGLEVGLVVQSFASDSPAQESGLKIGDVITSANGVRVKTFEDLFALMQEMKPGDEMKLECYRLEESNEHIWGFKVSEPFTVTFKMQAKHDDTSSAPSTSSYPGA